MPTTTKRLISQFCSRRLSRASCCCCCSTCCDQIIELRRVTSASSFSSAVVASVGVCLLSSYLETSLLFCEVKAAAASLLAFHCSSSRDIQRRIATFKFEKKRQFRPMVNPNGFPTRSRERRISKMQSMLFCQLETMVSFDSVFLISYSAPCIFVSQI